MREPNKGKKKEQMELALKVTIIFFFVSKYLKETNLCACVDLLRSHVAKWEDNCLR